MAVLNTLNNQQQQQGQGQAPVINTGASSAPMSSPQQHGTSSGRFVNLQNYLNANKNFDTAGAITNKADEKSNTTKQGITTGAQQFGQQVSQNTPGYDQSLSESITKDPNSFLQNQSQKDALQRIASGYKGPESFDTSSYQKDVNQLQNLNSLSGTEQGRYQVLQNLFAKPTYTGGQQKLDQLLLQRQPGSIDKVQAGLNTAATSANEALTGAQSAAAQQVTAAQQAAEQARQHTQSDISGAYGNTLGEVQKQLSQQQADQNQAIENATKAFRSGNLSDDVFNNLNLAGQNRSGVQGMINEANALGIDPTQYLQVKAAQQANLNTAANAGQASRLGALQNIAGLAGAQVGQGQNWSGPSAFNANALTSQFNSAALQNQIAQIREQQAAAEAARQQKEAVDRISNLNYR